MHGSGTAASGALGALLGGLLATAAIPGGAALGATTPAGDAPWGARLALLGVVSAVLGAVALRRREADGGRAARIGRGLVGAGIAIFLWGILDVELMRVLRLPTVGGDLAFHATGVALAVAGWELARRPARAAGSGAERQRA